MITLSDARVLRPGPDAVLLGHLDGEPVLVKHVAPTSPWTDRGSSFFGGHGLAPPFVPLPLHEAQAWERVDPARVVAAGTSADGSWLVLRARPGTPPSGTEDPERLAIGLFHAVANLHAADVVHRDVRPANVLVGPDGTVELIDLDVARVAGLGPVGRIGARAFRAPESWAGEGGPGVDVYGVGATLRSLHPGLSGRMGELVDACLAGPSDRPSAHDALRQLGERAPEPAVSAPHFWARSWWSAGWADALVLRGDYAAIVRRADRDGAEAPALGALASRLLAVAPRAGREAWLALGTLCWALHAATGDARYAAQADEARVYARAPWHPRARGLDRLLDPATDAATRTDALCDVGLPTLALQEAIDARHAPRIARSAWALGDRARVDAALRAAHAHPLSVAVTASRLLLGAPDAADATTVAAAIREDALEAVRRLLAAGDLSGAARVAQLLPDPPEAWVPVSLAHGDLVGARAAALRCASANRWSPAIAVLVLGDPEATLEKRTQAAEVFLQSLPPAPTGREAAEALGALPGGEPEAAWARVVAALSLTDQPALLVEAATRADADARTWHRIVLEFAGRPDGAALATACWERATLRHPEDAGLHVAGGVLALAQGALERAANLARAAIGLAPTHGPAWLLLALTAANAGERRRAMASAEAFGVSADVTAALSAPGGRP